MLDPEEEHAAHRNKIVMDRRRELVGRSYKARKGMLEYSQRVETN